MSKRSPLPGDGVNRAPAGGLFARVRDTLLSLGVAAVGVTTADPFPEVKSMLEDRRRRGLAADMNFTYRNPARSTDPRRSLPAAESMVVAAWRYWPRESCPARDGVRLRRKERLVTHVAHASGWGTVARYAGEDNYGRLRAALAEAAGLIESEGYRTRVLVDDNALVDRAAAVRAGLGWYGRNSCVMVGDEGSWFVLGALLTDAPLARSDPAIGADAKSGSSDPGRLRAAGCGPCRRCIELCPTGAITPRGEVDARRCLAWLLQSPGVFPFELREALGDRIYGCDVCQEVCPYNRVRGESGSGRRAPAVLVPPRVRLAELVLQDDATLLERFGRWYIPAREPRYLRRNALVVIGNVGSAADRETVEVLRRASEHPDPLVRAHAAWAARRLRVEEELEVHRDDHPLVRAEVEAFERVPPAPGARVVAAAVVTS
ncbi:MAG: epoxyqueuosine reductase [Acidimicrobiales bacterium]|nr:MAG: epoxyqueuosine reductase [Acidimicrobiales bacterium]